MQVRSNANVTPTQRETNDTVSYLLCYALTRSENVALRLGLQLVVSSYGHLNRVLN